MGKPNRKHRAAKQRARSGGADFSSLAGTDGRAPTAEDIGNAIMAAAMDAAQRGIPGSIAGEPVVAFAVRLAADDPLVGEVERGVSLAGQHLVTRAFHHGWLPADIQQAARRRVDEFAVGFMIDTIAGYMAPFDSATVDETWLAQLGDLSAEVWWSDSAVHFGQWTAKHLLTTAEALGTVIDALALLMLLPKLELIRSLPGTARTTVVVPHHIDEKILGRVRGLLAKAESTSFPEEAETLSAKAQELMTKYALDRVLVDADHAVPDLPGARRIWLDTPYTDAKALLIDVVASANRCRAIFASAWGFMTVIGDDADLDAVELLSTSLLVQATRAMIADGDNAARTDEARTRAFRKAFLIAYATRIGERLAAATAATIAESPEPQRLLPVLASHQLAVDKAFDTLFPQVRNRGISIRSAAGWDAGRAAADRAHLQP
ncbi:DUF2786 domain-containing protein [Nocardia sp. NPDC059240]|uniref:DUF2786 domain-containing protein n=1 Tax=Nocardia sp. NPDC059240 TaxID=3346786 RepID=UPI00369BF9A7